MQLCSSFVLSFEAASKLTISGINLLLLATQLTKQKYRLHPKYTLVCAYTPSNIYTCMHITFGCYYHTAPTQGVYVLDEWPEASSIESYNCSPNRAG